MSNQNPLKVFISYAPGDHELMLEFTRFLAPLKRDKSIVVWHQGEIIGGRSREDAIDEQLKSIDIFLPLLSAEYYADENIWENELIPAFKRRDSGKCEVTPIWLRSFVLPNDFSDLMVLPIDEYGQPKAITSWDKDKKDEAFTAAVRGLLRVIGTLKEEKTSMGLSSTADVLSLVNIWRQFPLKKGIPRLKILQLNRALAFGKAAKPFANSENYRDKNLFFFIAACKTQNPDNIVNRLFYYCEDTFDKYDCDNNDTLDNVPVHDFEIKLTPKSTWDYFWNHFKSKLRDFKETGTNDMLGEGELSFEEFVALAPELLRQTKRIPFVCRIPENEWENTLDATGHLKYLIKQFSGIPRNANKFVFFFLLELDDLHNCYCHAESKVAARFESVKRLCAESFDTAHMELVELMDHATVHDVRSWLSDLIDDKSGTRTLDDYFNLLLDCLLRELNPIEKELYQRKKAFNMDRLVIMQRYAYLYLK